jgi:5-methylcytosine-specific restriction endonuclease McrA
VQHVFVLDTCRRPLSPIHPGEARVLLSAGKAAVLRRFPFTIIMRKEQPEKPSAAVTVKIDPGSKVTGIALVEVSSGKVLFGAELEHRGRLIKARLESRRAVRRNRRSRKTRYRKPRFLNRRRPEGWLPPSLQHRVLTTLTWVNRFRKLCNVVGLAVERVKFDTQALQYPEISGIEYQQGTLQGYTVKEYLLEKWNRTCAYCGAKDLPLQIEHIVAKVNGGSNRISNLTLACASCNEKKGKLPVEVFLKNKPEVLKRVLASAKRPLRDAAAVNATRNALTLALTHTDLPVETGTGAQTKFNRARHGYLKTHWIDAACVGDSGSAVILDPTIKPLQIRATGHGNRQMCRTDKFGFPNKHRTRQAAHFGFHTGDIVRAVVPRGKKAGTHQGRVTCRAKGSFDIRTATEWVAGISYRYCVITYKQDGYCYDASNIVKSIAASATRSWPSARRVDEYCANV